MNDSTSIQLFHSDEFGTIRALSVAGEPWFVAKDVCEALGVGNSRQALARLDDDEKGVISTDTPGGKQQVQTVNEPGLYTLVLSSRKPEAHAFKRWVTHDVLPALRRDGAYVASDGTEDDSTLMARALIAADRAIKRKDRELEELRPKALFADAVAASDKTMLIGELAKVLRQNGVEMGQNRLFKWMRDNGYLISRKGSSYNMPTQRSMDLGLFRVKETAVTHSDGHVTTNFTTKLMPKGQMYFLQKFCGDGALND